MPKRLEITIVGMRHRLDAPRLREIAEQVPLQMVLEREPANTYDENAISVVLDEGRSKGMVVGYISKHTALVLAPAMDEGRMLVDAATLESVNPTAGTGELTVFHHGAGNKPKATTKGKKG